MRTFTKLRKQQDINFEKKYYRPLEAWICVIKVTGKLLPVQSSVVQLSVEHNYIQNGCVQGNVTPNLCFYGHDTVPALSRRIVSISVVSLSNLPVPWCLSKNPAARQGLQIVHRLEVF